VTGDPTRALARPPGTLRVAWLVSMLTLRRKLHRVTAALTRKRAAAPGRAATPPKKRGGNVLLGLLAILSAFQGTTVSVSIVRQVALAAERRAEATSGIAIVNDSTKRWVDYGEENRLRERSRLINEDDWRASVDLALEREARDEGIRDQRKTRERVEELETIFERHGTEGFRTPVATMWYGDNAADMLAPLGLVGLLLTIVVALFGIAGPDQELAKVDSSFEWWFTFPVPARGLLLARVFETTLANPLSWFLLGPFFSVVFWCAGYAWLGIPMGLAATVYVGLLTGGVRVAAETGLRRFFSMRAVARVQAVLVLLAYLTFVVAIAAASPDWLETLSRVARRLPAWLLLSPISPVRMAEGRLAAMGTALGCVTLAVVTVASSVALGGHLIRDGLAKTTGIEGARHHRARRLRGGASMGIVRKEVTMLRRDRNLFVQTIAAPGMVFGVQLLMHRGLFAQLASEGRHIAAAAFGAGAFVLATGACNTLALDVPILWLYCTFPTPLERLIADKALFWCGIAVLVALATFLALTGARPAAMAAGLPALPLAIVGVVLCAFIATGIGVLGTDPLESEPRRRVQVSMVYLYMLVATMFGYALYTPSLWAKFAQIVLCTLLVFALWQKVRDHAPYLLDPAAAPPPSLSVADGVLAALAFFVLQGVLALLFGTFDFSPGVRLLFAFTGAGLVLTISTAFIFWRNHLPNMAAQLGLRPPSAERWGRSAFRGVAAGLVVAVMARGYIFAIDHVDFLRRVRDETVSLSPVDRASDMFRWIAVLAIFAAPLFEEFIFRAVLYSGFRRSLGAGRAAVASALVFAIMHPPIAFAPVFLLGVAAAWTFERSRFLLAPVLTHMTYNAITVGLVLK